MTINIDLRKAKKHNLSLEQYLILALLYNKPDLDEELYDNCSTTEILMELEDGGFLRIIDTDIVLEGKAFELFENKYTQDAKKVLEYMNELKRESGISNRPFTYKAHSKEIIARLMKEVLRYKYDNWIGTDYQMYLRPSTLFNKTKFYNYVEAFEQDKNKSQTSAFEIVK
jgi:uncharacterized phage protein (TIGR02220 family)